MLQDFRLRKCTVFFLFLGEILEVSFPKRNMNFFKTDYLERKKLFQRKNGTYGLIHHSKPVVYYISAAIFLV